MGERPAPAACTKRSRRSANIEPTDRRRIVRAHELPEAGHEPHRRAAQLWTGHTRHPTLLAALVMDRDALTRGSIAA